MVIALSDIGKRKHAERIERRCSFTQSAAPRGRLIEDEGKSAVEPANSDERWYCSFDVGRARTRRDQAKIGLGDGRLHVAGLFGGGFAQSSGFFEKTLGRAMEQPRKKGQESVEQDQEWIGP